MREGVGRVARYIHGAEGQGSWADEAQPYTLEATIDQYFGLFLSDITWPNGNPKTPLPAQGERRGPHVLSSDAKTYPFEIEYAVLDQQPPFHNALGKVTVTNEDPDATPGTGDEYTKYLFEEANRLPTISVAAGQQDDGVALLDQFFAGVKSNLRVEASQGELVRFTQAFKGTLRTDDDATPAPPALNIPDSVEPFKFWMLGDIAFDQSDGGGNMATLATVNQVSGGWDNGIEENHHGKGREPFSISETIGAAKYEWTLGITVTDLEYYHMARDDKEPVDITVPFHRPPGQASLTDASILTLEDSKITDAPFPYNREGHVEKQISVQPRNTSLELRIPA